mmetsp:Transcript_4814/g.9787  ORF Transcript_4814/g.9787 Transcript_4814/m.9787 type:complete len:209 (-) Transcript_4814:71-697(-)
MEEEWPSIARSARLVRPQAHLKLHMLASLRVLSCAARTRAIQCFGVSRKRTRVTPILQKSNAFGVYSQAENLAAQRHPLSCVLLLPFRMSQDLERTHRISLTRGETVAFGSVHFFEERFTRLSSALCSDFVRACCNFSTPLLSPGPLPLLSSDLAASFRVNKLAPLSPAGQSRWAQGSLSKDSEALAYPPGDAESAEERALEVRRPVP